MKKRFIHEKHERRRRRKKERKKKKKKDELVRDVISIESKLPRNDANKHETNPKNITDDFSN
jgi:hypothetical protein